MTRPICPACGKPCQRTGCRPCRFDSDGPIPTIAEALSGKCEPYTASEVRLDLYARAVRDHDRRELADAYRARQRARIVFWSARCGKGSTAQRADALRGLSEAVEALSAFNRAMRATRGR